MEKINLAREIVDFSIKYQLFANAENMKTEGIARQLDESWFVELLVQTLMNAKYRENIDHKKLQELLSEIEKIRLELEYDE